MTIRAALAVTLLLGACADQAAVAPPVAVTPAPETNVNLKDTLFPSSWIAIDLAGTPVIAGTSVTLAFDPTGRVSGRGGCNNFAGGATLEGDRLSFTPLASTRMACIDNGVSAQEAAYFDALGKVRRAVVTAAGTLELRGEDGGEIVVFVRDTGVKQP